MGRSRDEQRQRDGEEVEKERWKGRDDPTEGRNREGRRRTETGRLAGRGERAPC